MGVMGRSRHTNQRCRAPQANFEVGYTHVERRSHEARAKQVLEADARHTECSTRLLLCLSAIGGAQKQTQHVHLLWDGGVAVGSRG